MEIIKPNESFLSPADIIGKLYSNYFKSNLIATKSTKGVIKNAVKVWTVKYFLILRPNVSYGQIL